MLLGLVVGSHPKFSHGLWTVWMLTPPLYEQEDFLVTHEERILNHVGSRVLTAI